MTWSGVEFIINNLKPNTTYNFSLICDVSPGLLYFQFYGLNTASAILDVYGGYLRPFNTGDNTSIKIRISSGNNNVENSTFNITNVQLEEGSVATDYQPYNGAIVHEKQIADVEHIETIYDMSSSDSNINKGYTSGLMFTTTPSYSIMSQSQKNKYKYFRVTAHLVNTDLIFEFMNNIDGYARGGFACQASWLDDTTFCFGHIGIVPWGTINGTNCKTQNGSTVTDRRDDSNYYISKIEGVLL